MISDDFETFIDDNFWRGQTKTIILVKKIIHFIKIQNIHSNKIFIFLKRAISPRAMPQPLLVTVVFIVKGNALLFSVANYKLYVNSDRSNRTTSTLCCRHCPNCNRRIFYLTDFFNFLWDNFICQNLHNQVKCDIFACVPFIAFWQLSKADTMLEGASSIKNHSLTAKTGFAQSLSFIICTGWFVFYWSALKMTKCQTHRNFFWSTPVWTIP